MKGIILAGSGDTSLSTDEGDFQTAFYPSMINQ